MLITESQNIEFKESWRDEYLKWICGFANAQGGKLYVGIRDNGEVCGVSDIKKLIEDIPNKVRDLMGILVDVNSLRYENHEYIEIITEAYPYPISYRSRPYNPDIANVFFRAGEIEAWGRGIERIIAACKTGGYPEPEFQYDGGGLWTIFHFDESYQKAVETTQKTTQKTAQKNRVELTETQMAIVEYLKKHPQTSRKELAEQISNITENGIKYNLARLQELGILKRIGGRKLGYWAFIDNNHK